MQTFWHLALLIACATAQGIPRFDTVPTNMTAGLSYAISWEGGDGTVSGRQLPKLPKVSTNSFITASFTVSC